MSFSDHSLRKSFCTSLWVALACFLVTALHADWVTLKNGSKLRGVDFQRRTLLGGKKVAQIALDTGRTVVIPAASIVKYEASPPGETVEFRGEEMTLREKISALKKEGKKRDRKILKSIGLWAKAGKGAEAAEAEFAALSERERERFLGLALLTGNTREVRSFAAKELAVFKTSHSVQALAKSMVTDRDKGVRRVAMRSLRVVDYADTANYILPHLLSENQNHRIRASNALTRFRNKRTIPVLIAVALRSTWSGFGRGYIMQATQRAYIGDYELVSGGTGFSIVEVADPVVRTLQTGVILDVHVKTVEAHTHLRNLRIITGEDYGDNVLGWKTWWKESQSGKKSASDS